MQINRVFEYYDHKNLEKTLMELKNKYEFLEIGSLGKSIFGKSIPRITLGNGKKNVIYIGAHHGMEWITSALLMQFVHDLCEEYQNGRSVFDVSTHVLFETRKIHIVPMLNPDGIDYAIHGVNEDNVIYNRLIRMNGSTDFSHWQANARGIDLNHNYNSGFEEYKIIERKENIICGATKYSGEYPESEPETRALCNFVRFERPSLALTLHTQGEEIYYTSGEKTSDISLSLAKTLSRLTGYKISFPSGTAKYGGFTDWFIEEFDKPSFTLECGHGENPLPFSDFEKIYSHIKRALFITPILV
ncbi:MAG: M14 family metallocarboxypeptidase [Clostridia bacterium]|nr:M14 family metallocarboxypeptidase [Clostridia bacterium]